VERDYRNQHADNSEAFNKRKEHPRGVNLVEEMQRREQKGQLNPDWVEWLMGWPIGWTSLEPMKELIWLDWNVDPADAYAKKGNIGPLPRVATGIKNKVNRLKAIGNGQVPQVVKIAWEILSQ